MRIIIVRNTMIIPVGRQGENEAQRIIWPDIVTSWSKLYGDGVFSFAVKRNGDDTPYPAVVTTENGSLIWVPTNADTANVGFGSCELVYTVGDVIAKSQTWRTETYPSLTGEGATEPPEPYQSWVDTVLKAGAAAEAAASKPAYIGDNGNWYTWDVAAQQYADSGTHAQGPTGAAGADGKSAYAYAVDGGYNGTEAEFAEKLAQGQLAGTTDDLTPTQVYDAVSAGIPVKVKYTDSTYGILLFTAFNVAETMDVIASQSIVYYRGAYILAELFGYKYENTWGFMATTLAQKTDIPSALPNPNALTLKIGSTTATYDGSSAQTVDIPIGSGGGSWSQISGKPFDTIDGNTLVSRSGTLCVNTTDDAEQDNTRPITSSGVHVICGNINALLQAI